jgi:tetratricopeptide (TPR) repeat protein
VALEDGGAPVVSLAQIDHSIDAWSRNLDANPKDFLAATNLATLYQGRGRLSYDLTDHERALAAARSALAIEPSHAPARVIGRPSCSRSMTSPRPTRPPTACCALIHRRRVHWSPGSMPQSSWVGSTRHVTTSTGCDRSAGRQCASGPRDSHR